MKQFRHLCAVLLALAVLCGLWILPGAAQEGGQAETQTILFTHDMHSHLLPALDENGAEYGGSARLMTAIRAQREKDPNALLVDAGDFSMGSLFQTAYADAALELRLMGAMGYDATTFGNHEYDYRASGLASMLNAALDSGDPLPAIVEANYYPPQNGQDGYGQDSQAVWNALNRYGVTEYTVIENDSGVFVVFGIMGEESDEYAPMSGMILYDRFEKAQQVVDKATQDCRENYGVEDPTVICLSHSGTDGKGKGEDYDLARKVDGIDLIVSGHSHTTLPEPIHVNDTWIVSAGEYTKNLGVIRLDVSGGAAQLVSYELIPIDNTLRDDPAISRLVEEYKKEVDRTYLDRFDLSFDEVLVHNPYSFDSVDAVYDTAHESTLGNLLTDAYRWAGEQALGGTVDAAFTASGVIRASFAQGDITVSDVFDAASLGIGADGVPGYPLIAVYLTGKDLKTVLEVDASVAPLMTVARLFNSGLEYSFNTHRMILNRVTDTALRLPDGTAQPLENKQLYRVVTGLYCGQMLGSVEDKSLGLLSVTPRNEDGTPIDMDRLEDYIIHDADGNEVKEWYAVASYLQTMGGEMDARYGQTDGRKMVSHSWNPIQLLRHPNRFSVILVLLILAIIAVVAVVLRLTVFSRYKRTIRRGGGRGYRPYRG